MVIELLLIVRYRVLGADILRIVLIRLWNSLLNNPKYKDDVRFLITIHDEINYSIKKSRLKEILKIIKENMEIQPPGWPIKMEVGIEIGTNWGTTFAFEFKDGELVPKYETEHPKEVQDDLEREEALNEVALESDFENVFTEGVF